MLISLPAMKSRSSIRGAMLGRAVLLPDNPGDGARKTRPGRKKTPNPGVGLWMRIICLQRVEMGKT